MFAKILFFFFFLFSEINWVHSEDNSYISQNVSFALSPQTNINKFQEDVIPNLDFNSFEGGSKGLIELIDVMNSEIGRKYLNDVLRVENIRIDVGIKQELRGVEFFNYMVIDIFSLNQDLIDRIENTIQQKLDGRVIGGITGLNERSLGRIIVGVKSIEDSQEKTREIAPLIMEIQPSASWRLLQSELNAENENPDLLLEKYPESNWRKIVPHTLALFFSKIGFRKIYGMSAEAIRENKKHADTGKFSKKYSYYSSTLSVDDISNWDEFLEFLSGKEFENVFIFYGRELFFKRINQIEPNYIFNKITNNKDLKKTRNFIISVLNDLKNDLNLFSKFLIFLRDKNLYMDFSIKILFNDLKNKSILSEDGSIKEGIELSQENTELIRWLNIAVLNNLFKEFINKRKGVYQEKRTIQPRDLKTYYTQPYDNMFWTEPKDVNMSFETDVFGESVINNYKFHEFINPEYSLESFGLKHFEIKTVPINGNMKILVVFINKKENLSFTWELATLLSGMKGKITPVKFDQYNVRELTLWLRSKAKIPLFYPPQSIAAFELEILKTAA